MRSVITYPPRPSSAAVLGYNLAGLFDNGHVDLAAAGGASVLRTQFAWSNVESYSTGTLGLTAAEQSFLAYCATKGVRPALVAAYGPPWATIGTLTTTALVPAGSAAGTPIPVAAYGFSITTASPACFVTAPALEVGGVTLTGRWSYYGSLITLAAAGSIQLAAATAIAIPSGATLNVQQLRYPSPMTDADASNAAFVRYAAFLAAQIAAAGAHGFVLIWNEYIWPNDCWGATQRYYDTPPGAITLTTSMKAILTQCQTSTPPAGVAYVNGTSDKTGFGGMAVQGISVPGAVTLDSMHPYNENPEGFDWDYYAWGYNNNRPLPASLAAGDSWWEIVNPADQTSNFRNMAFVNDLTAGAPGLMASETGLQTADDTVQARWLARRVAALWGLNAAAVPYVLDDGTTGSTFSVAPNLQPRPAYTALKAMTAVVGRMAAGNDASRAPGVLGWQTPGAPWPLRATIVNGAQGHAVVFLWQMTADTTGTVAWSSIPTPPAAAAVLSVPGGVSVAECFNVRTGAAVQAAVAGNGPWLPEPWCSTGTVTVPVFDEVVALRLAPQ